MPFLSAPLHHARSEAPSLCNKLSTTSASTSLQQPHHLYINKSPTITSHHCSSKAIPLIKPFLLAIPQPILPCNQPLVYHFVLLSLTFVKAYILSYIVIKQWNEINKDVVLGLPVFVSFSSSLLCFYLHFVFLSWYQSLKFDQRCPFLPEASLCILPSTSPEK